MTKRDKCGSSKIDEGAVACVARLVTDAFRGAGRAGTRPAFDHRPHRHVVKEEKRAGLAKLPMLIEGDVVPLSAVAVEGHATAPVNKQTNSHRLTGKSVGITALAGSAHSGQSSQSLKGHTRSLDPFCWRSAGIAMGVAITISASAHRHQVVLKT